MAVSTAAFYKIISIKTTSLLGRTRNMGVSFGLMGITFIPELFNPFLVFRESNSKKGNQWLIKINIIRIYKYQI